MGLVGVQCVWWWGAWSVHYAMWGASHQKKHNCELAGGEGAVLLLKSDGAGPHSEVFGDSEKFPFYPLLPAA